LKEEIYAQPLPLSTLADTKMKLSPSGDFLYVYTSGITAKPFYGKIWLRGNPLPSNFQSGFSIPEECDIRANCVGYVDFAPNGSTYATCGGTYFVQMHSITSSHSNMNKRFDFSGEYLQPNQGGITPSTCHQISFNPANGKLVVLWRESQESEGNNVTMTLAEYSEINGTYGGEPVIIDQFNDSINNYNQEREFLFNSNGSKMAITNLPHGQVYIRDMISNQTEFIDVIKHCDADYLECYQQIKISPDLNWLIISSVSEENTCNKILYSLKTSLLYDIITTVEENSETCYFSGVFDRDSSRILQWVTPYNQNFFQLASIELPSNHEHWNETKSIYYSVLGAQERFDHAVSSDYNTLYTWGSGRSILSWTNPSDGTYDDRRFTEWADSDKDGVTDLIEVSCFSDPLDVNSLPIDNDGDGQCNAIDHDDDNDGFSDRVEVDCLSDPFEVSSIPSHRDLDLDGICDAIDDDRDGDDVENSLDVFPDNPSEWADFDGDGIGDNSDADSDNDGFSNLEDKFPRDPEEWLDTDGDGVGDNSDLFPRLDEKNAIQISILVIISYQLIIRLGPKLSRFIEEQKDKMHEIERKRIIREAKEAKRREKERQKYAAEQRELERKEKKREEKRNPLLRKLTEYIFSDIRDYEITPFTGATFERLKIEVFVNGEIRNFVYSDIYSKDIEEIEREMKADKISPKPRPRYRSSRYYDGASDVGDSGSDLGDTMDE
jgi:hypothetical protein